MRTFITLDKEDRPRPDGPERDTYPDALVEHFLRAYTIEGEVVLDPFAGFGTTLVVAERMNRRAIGVEFLEDRATFIAGRIGDGARIIHGDSRRIDELGLGPVDFSMTSPPYMCRNDPQDPLQGYTVDGEGYDAYLEGLTSIYGRLRTVLKPERRAVVNVSNIKRYDGLTTLAFDVCRAISSVMVFEGEVVLGWNDDDHGFGYDHEYCLVFANR
jgi:DNA modification methylase